MYTEDCIKTVDAADNGVGGVRVFMDFWHCIEDGYMMMQSKAMVKEFNLRLAECMFMSLEEFF